MNFQSGRASEDSPAFTLVEMLVAMTVIVIMIVILASISVEVARAWKGTSGTIEEFRDARASFEAMTRTISHATLGTYYDYVDSSSPPNFRADLISDPAKLAAFVPAGYARRSDLQFVSGTTTKTLLNSIPTQDPYPITHAIFFTAPLGYTETGSYTGFGDTLNGCGFYVTYGPDLTAPSFLSATTVPKLYRYRLMQFTAPTENLAIYDPQGAGNQWFLGAIANNYSNCVSQLAPNIVTLVILPRLSPADQAATGAPLLAPNYDYDSRDKSNTVTYNLLPPEVDVTMVAIDEASALKLGNTSAPPNLTAGAPFTDSTKLSTDLATMENNLGAIAGNAAGNHIPLHYRIFHTEVAINGAKWGSN